MDKVRQNAKAFAAEVEARRWKAVKDITLRVRCSATIGTAFKELGLLARTASGNLAPNWEDGRCPLGAIKDKYYEIRRRHGEGAAQTTPTLRRNCDNATPAEVKSIPLSDAIAVVIAAGGTVVFGERK